MRLHWVGRLLVLLLALPLVVGPMLALMLDSAVRDIAASTAHLELVLGAARFAAAGERANL